MEDRIIKQLIIMKLMKSTLLFSAILLNSFVVFATLPSADLETDLHKLSGNLRAYPYAENEPPAQTPPRPDTHLSTLSITDAMDRDGSSEIMIISLPSRIWKRLKKPENSPRSVRKHSMCCAT